MTVTGWSGSERTERRGARRTPAAEIERLIDAAAVHAVRTERTRLGCELHDTVCQELAGLALSADALAGRLRTTAPDEACRAAELARGIRNALLCVRTTLGELVPEDVGPGGLPEALERLAIATERDYGVRCAARCQGPAPAGESARELFLVASEGVSNAARHARASGIEIDLECCASATRLVVSDDGVGLPGEQVTRGRSGGRGLMVMRRRAAALGGVLIIQSIPGSGTTIRCEVIHDGNNHDGGRPHGPAGTSQEMAGHSYR